jgi:hypothetical protein
MKDDDILRELHAVTCSDVSDDTESENLEGDSAYPQLVHVNSRDLVP